MGLKEFGRISLEGSWECSEKERETGEENGRRRRRVIIARAQPRSSTVNRARSSISRRCCFPSSMFSSAKDLTSSPRSACLPHCQDFAFESYYSLSLSHQTSFSLGPHDCDTLATSRLRYLRKQHKSSAPFTTYIQLCVCVCVLSFFDLHLANYNIEKKFTN